MPETGEVHWNRLNPQNEANWMGEDNFEDDKKDKKKDKKEKKKKGGWLKKLKGGGGAASSSSADLASEYGEGVETRGMVVREVADKLILKVYLEKEGYSGASTIQVNIDAKAPVVRKVAGDRLHVGQWREYGLYLSTPEGLRTFPFILVIHLAPWSSEMHVADLDTGKIKRTEKLSTLAAKYKADAPFKILLKPWTNLTPDDTLDDDFAEEDFD
jgi:hypothetical protein